MGKMVTKIITIGAMWPSFDRYTDSSPKQLFSSSHMVRILKLSLRTHSIICIYCLLVLISAFKKEPWFRLLRDDQVGLVPALVRCLMLMKILPMTNNSSYQEVKMNADASVAQASLT